MKHSTASEIAQTSLGDFKAMQSLENCDKTKIPENRTKLTLILRENPELYDAAAKKIKIFDRSPTKYTKANIEMVLKIYFGDGPLEFVSDSRRVELGEKTAGGSSIQIHRNWVQLIIYKCSKSTAYVYIFLGWFWSEKQKNA